MIGSTLVRMALVEPGGSTSRCDSSSETGVSCLFAPEALPAALGTDGRFYQSQVVSPLVLAITYYTYDPVLLVRSPAYAVSFAKRLTGQ